MKFEQAFDLLKKAQNASMISQSANSGIFNHPRMPSARVDFFPGGQVSRFDQATKEETEADDWVLSFYDSIEDLDEYKPNEGHRLGSPMTGSNFPKEILSALGLPPLVQEFTLRVKRHAFAEVECRYYPVIQSPGEQDVKGTD